MASDSIPASTAAPLNRPMLTLSIMLATLIQTLDSTIANVALPHMQGTLSASQDEITWVLTSYIVAAAIATPLTGWLSDRLSVKRLLVISIAGFTVASALCGLSETLTQIVASRLLQGVFGASLVPLSQSILLDINPREKQGQAMAVWGMGVMVGPILGPTLGGWLTDSYNWRWVFFINVPIGAFALFGVSTFLPAKEPKHGVKFDAFGFATLSLAIGAFQAMLDRGEQLDWFGSLEIRIEALLAALSFAFFLAHTATAGAKSFFRYELLKDRNFATGVCFIFVIGAVMYATRALLPPMLQNLMNYPGRDDRARHGAKRRGHDDRDDVRGAPAEALRRAPHAACRLPGIRVRALADDALHDRAVRLRHRLARRDPGLRPRARVRAALSADVLDAHTRVARGRHRHLQPDAQYRQQYGHLHRADADDAQHAGGARGPRGQRERLQSGDAADARKRLDLRHGDAQPVDHAAGRDDRVSERLQADVRRDAARHPARAADPPGPPDAGRHRSPTRRWIDAWRMLSR